MRSANRKLVRFNLPILNHRRQGLGCKGIVVMVNIGNQGRKSVARFHQKGRYQLLCIERFVFQEKSRAYPSRLSLWARRCLVYGKHCKNIYCIRELKGVFNGDKIMGEMKEISHVMKIFVSTISSRTTSIEFCQAQLQSSPVGTEISFKFDNYHPLPPPPPGKVERQLKSHHIWSVGSWWIVYMVIFGGRG